MTKTQKRNARKRLAVARARSANHRDFELELHWLAQERTPDKECDTCGVDMAHCPAQVKTKQKYVDSDVEFFDARTAYSACWSSKIVEHYNSWDWSSVQHDVSSLGEANIKEALNELAHNHQSLVKSGNVWLELCVRTQQGERSLKWQGQELDGIGVADVIAAIATQGL